MLLFFKLDSFKNKDERNGEKNVCVNFPRERKEERGGKEASLGQRASGISNKVIPRAPQISPAQEWVSKPRAMSSWPLA